MQHWYVNAIILITLVNITYSFIFFKKLQQVTTHMIDQLSDGIAEEKIQIRTIVWTSLFCQL